MPKAKTKPAPEPGVVLFIQDHSGDYNLERNYYTRETAMEAFNQIRTYGGYWMNDGEVFVPFYRVDFVRITDELEGGARG